MPMETPVDHSMDNPVSDHSPAYLSTQPTKNLTTARPPRTKQP